MEKLIEFTEENDVEDSFLDLHENKDLIKTETERLVQMKIKFALEIKDLKEAVRDAETTAETHLANFHELQNNYESLSESYKREQELREEICTRLMNTDQVTALMENEFNFIQGTIEEIKIEKLNIVNRFEKEANDLKQIIIRLEETFTSQKTKYENTLLEKEYIIKNLSEANEELKIIKEEKLALEIKLADINEELKSSNEKNLGLLQSYAGLKKTSAQELDDLQLKFNNLNEEYDKAKTTETELNEKIIELQSALDLKTKSIQDLKNSEDTLKLEIEQLKENILTLNLDIQKNNEMNQLEVKNLSEKISCQEKLIEQLTIENEKLATEVEEAWIDEEKLETRLSIILDDNSMLEERIAADQLTNEQLQIETADLQLKIKQLETDLINEQNVVQEKKKELEDLETNYVSMQEKLHNKLSEETIRVEKCNKEFSDLHKEFDKHKEMHKAVLREYQTALEKSETASIKKLEEITNNMKEEKKKMEKIKNDEIEKLKNQMIENEKKYDSEVESLKNKIETIELDVCIAKQSVKIVTKQNENLKFENDSLKRQNILDKEKRSFKLTQDDSDTPSSASSFCINPDFLRNRLKLIQNSQVLKRKADCTPSNSSSYKKSSLEPSPPYDSNTEEKEPKVKSKLTKRKKVSN